MPTLGLAFEHHTGQDPCITLLHGFPLDRAMWNPTLQALRRAGRRVLVPDLRGFGHSEVVAPSSVKDMAADVVALWDALGIPQSVVVGFSMGGYVALELALHHAGRVSGLALVDTRGEGDDAEAQAKRRATADTVVLEGTQALADAMLPKLLTPHAMDSRLADHVREIMLRQSPAGVATALRAMAGRDDVLGRLGSIQAPTLVVVGEADAITPPASAETLAAGIAGSRLVRIPDAGHLVPMEQAGEWTQALLEFLDEQFTGNSAPRA